MNYNEGILHQLIIKVVQLILGMDLQTFINFQGNIVGITYFP